MKTLAVIAGVLALLTGFAAKADTFRVDITNTTTLAALPELCPTLRASLPPAQRENWSNAVCIAEFAMEGMARANVLRVVKDLRATHDFAVKIAREPFRLEPIPSDTVGIGQ